MVPGPGKALSQGDVTGQVRLDRGEWTLLFRGHEASAGLGPQTNSDQGGLRLHRLQEPRRLKPLWLWNRLGLWVKVFRGQIEVVASAGLRVLVKIFLGV